MGWFSGLWSSDNSKSDPLGKLDPALKEFLEKESPVKYNLAKKAEDESRKAEPLSADNPSDPESKDLAAESPKPIVPPESLFPDGRYAHVWQTYRPLHDIENETKTDSEKLQDVLDGYKERKRLIAKTSVENCADEQWEWRTCMTEGGIRAKATLCSREVKKFERCYGVMNRLLRTLGYLETFSRDPQIEEDIQVHAFDIYQAMLSQERAIAAARKAGEPIPTFPSLIPRQSDSEETAYFASLPSSEQQSLQHQLDLAGSETRRAQVLALHRRIHKEDKELSEGVQSWRDDQERKRLERIKDGKAGVVDQVMGLWNNSNKEDEKGIDDKNEDNK